MEGFDTDDLIEILRVRCQERGTQRARAKDNLWLASMEQARKAKEARDERRNR